MESFQSTVSLAANLFALLSPGLIFYFAKKQSAKAKKKARKPKSPRS